MIPITAQQVITGLGGTAGKFAPVAAPLATYGIGSEAAEAITADTKQKQTEALVGTGGAIATTGAFGAAALGAPVTVPIVIIATVGMGAKYAARMMNTSYHYNIDELFNPAENKRHMIGVGTGRFHKELANSEGRIDWGSMDTLNKYSILLTKHIHSLEEKIAAGDSWIPDGIRASSISKVLVSPVYAATSAMGITETAEEGMKAVTDRDNHKSDLKIAQSAHAELQAQMNALNLFKQYESEALQAQSRLTNGVSRDITLLDLDRDHNGVLNEEDKNTIRTTVKNDRYADWLLEKQLPALGVHFKNMSVAEAQQHIDERQATSTGIETGFQAPTQPEALTKGFLERIGDFFIKIWESIASFFSNKEKNTLPVLAVSSPAVASTAAPINTNDLQPAINPPAGPIKITTPAAQVGR